MAPTGTKGWIFSTGWSHDPVLKGVHWLQAVRKFSPTSLAEGLPHWFISPSAVAISSSSPKQHYWAYLSSFAQWAYLAFAGLHPGPTKDCVPSRMEAALAQ